MMWVKKVLIQLHCDSAQCCGKKVVSSEYIFRFLATEMSWKVHNIRNIFASGLVIAFRASVTKKVSHFDFLKRYCNGTCLTYYRTIAPSHHRTIAPSHGRRHALDPVVVSDAARLFCEYGAAVRQILARLEPTYLRAAARQSQNDCWLWRGSGGSHHRGVDPAFGRLAERRARDNKLATFWYRRGHLRDGWR